MKCGQTAAQIEKLLGILVNWTVVTLC